MMDQITPVYMIRENLANIPHYKLPPPYTIRSYQPGDEAAWERIHLEADKYTTITPTLFDEQFGRDIERLKERQFYLCDGMDTPVGTATAWFMNHNDQSYGRVHWVAIIPAEQGKGLAKPLLSAVCHRLRDLRHNRAYLDTASVRLPAIGLYLRFGFVPDIRSEREAEVWRKIRERLQS